VKKIPSDSVPLLDAQAILYVLFSLKDPKDRQKVVKKAKERFMVLNVSEEFLDHADERDVRFYADEALESLRSHKFDSTKAHEALSHYRAKMARELGVQFGKGGARVAQGHRP
jgi:hypothetical protein